MSQLPEDPRPSSSVPPPSGATSGYGPGGFSAPAATDAFGTPMAASSDTYASRWLRLAAAIIDGVVVGLPAYLVAFVVVGATDNGSADSIVWLIYMLLSLLYAPLLLMRSGESNGQTIGKQAVGIRVVHQEGGPMTFGRAALREIVGKTVLSAVTCGLYGILDALWCLWDPKRQCLHDKVGSTVVRPA